ncbi:MAG: hypothetical protein IJX62_01585 [Clostridia bacterium]|nr:hypothetical protein [Clostridia bacterium]
MNLSLFNRTRYKRILWQYAVVIGLISFAYVIATPIGLRLSSNVLFEDTVIPLLWSTLTDVMHYLFYWASFAYLLLFASRFSLRQSKGFLGTYAAVVAARYVAAMLAGYLENGFPTGDEFLTEVLFYLILDILLDWVMMAAAVLAVFLVTERAPWGNMRRVSEEQSPMSRWMPFEGMMDLRNPLLRVNLIIAAIPSLQQLIYRMIYDITYYGVARNLADLLWMISYYLGDLMGILIGYFFILLLLNRFYLTEEKARMEFFKDQD